MDKLPNRHRPPLRAVLFDAYGTLFDVYSVAASAEQRFPGRGEALARLWRDKQLEYSRLVSMADPGGRFYQPFWDLTRASLRHAAQTLGLALDEAAEERLMNEYRHLSAYPENRRVLQQLRALGLPAGILSNGDPAMIAVAVKSAGIADLIDPLISVGPLRCYKPDPRVYQHGLEVLRQTRPELQARQVLFVSSNGWDALGATWFGFTSFWLNRAGLPRETLDPPPTHEGRRLDDLLSLLGDPGGAADA